MKIVISELNIKFRRNKLMYNISSQKNPHFTNPMTDDYFNQNGSFFHKVNHIPEENFGTKKEELHERKIILKEEPSNDENPSIYKEFFLKTIKDFIS